MAKHNKQSWEREEGLVVGVDLGDQYSQLCVLSGDGEIRHEVRVRTTSGELQRWFSSVGPAMVVMEAGSHSPWVSRLLEQLGHRVIVADPRQLRLISHSNSKNDRNDARSLARIAAAMPELLHVVRHRSAEAQQDLMVIRARARLVEARTKLWCSLRGLAKSLGRRLPRRVTREALGEWSRLLEPLYQAIEDLAQRIQQYDAQLRELERKYPAALRLQQIAGVGPLISLTFVLTLEDPQRFARSRQAAGFRGGSAAVVDHQGRRSVPAQLAAPGSAVHLRAVWSRYRFAELRVAHRGAGRQERQEASGGGSGAQVGGGDASATGGPESL